MAEVGRPSKYEPEFVEQAKKLAKLGATDMEVADFFGVDVRTIHRWKNEHPEFCHSLNVGKEEADSRVVRSLYQRAVGFEHPSVKIFCQDGQVIEAPYREYVEPDTTAAIFWLKNRRKDEWRDDKQLSGPGRDGAHLLEIINDLDQL